MFQIILSIAALLLSIVILQLGNSMLAPTIVLNANQAGTSLSSVGLIPTVYGFGFVMGCFWARKLMKTVGHIRSFTAAGAALASLTLLMHLIPHTVALILFRGFMGVAIAIVMTCVDSWVGHVTPTNIRGRVMGFYSMITKLAYVGAPALLSYSLLISENAIIYAVLLFTISLIPVCLTKLPQPPIGPSVPTSFLSLFKDLPSTFVAVFVLGFTNTAILNLLPVYGVKIGLPTSQALALLTAVHLGGLVMQWPIGYLSDVFGRRNVLAAGFFISSTTAIFMTMTFAEEPSYAFILSLVWGGAALSLYSVALSHAIDRVDREQTVGVCATVLTIWSIGSIFGPGIAGVIMEHFDVKALYLFCGAFHGLTALFILTRLIISSRRKKRQGELTAKELEGVIWPQNRPLT